MHSLNGYNFFYSTCRETLPHSQNGAIALSKQSRASQNLPPLINSSLHVRQKVLDARPHLLAGRPDLVRRQHEAVPARVAQLRRERVLRAHDVVRVVDRAARGLVDGLADGAVLTAKKKKSSVSTLGKREEGAIFLQLRAMHSLDGGHGAGVDALELGVGRGERVARVAVRRHPQLRVRVPVHVHLDALAVADGAREGGEPGPLGGAEGGGACGKELASCSLGKFVIGMIFLPLKVSSQGLVDEPPATLQPVAQLRLMSVPMQLLPETGCLFLRQRRVLVCV